jgi:hypothetical protein
MCSTCGHPAGEPHSCWGSVDLGSIVTGGVTRMSSSGLGAREGPAHSRFSTSNRRQNPCTVRCLLEMATSGLGPFDRNEVIVKTQKKEAGVPHIPHIQCSSLVRLARTQKEKFRSFTGMMYNPPTLLFAVKYYTKKGVGSFVVECGFTAGQCPWTISF